MVLVVKNPPANAEDIRDPVSIPESGRSPGEGHGNPLQYSFLENAMNRRVWQATVHAVTELDMTEVTECTHARNVNLSHKTVSKMKTHTLAYQHYFSTGRMTGT